MDLHGPPGGCEFCDVRILWSELLTHDYSLRNSFGGLVLPLVAYFCGETCRDAWQVRRVVQ